MQQLDTFHKIMCGLSIIMFIGACVAYYYAVIKPYKQEKADTKRTASNEEIDALLNKVLTEDECEES